MVERPILSQDILSEEVMLIQYRVHVLDFDLEKEPSALKRMAISTELEKQHRILDHVMALWVQEIRSMQENV